MRCASLPRMPKCGSRCPGQARVWPGRASMPRRTTRRCSKSWPELPAAGSTDTAMVLLKSKPKVLMLIPSETRRDIEEAVRADAHPTMDYAALRESLGADLLDYSALAAGPQPALARIMR